MPATITMFATRDLDPAAIDEIIEEGTKKPRARSEAPNRSSDMQMRQFVVNMAGLYPLFMGGDPEKLDDPALAGATLLSRVIAALDYTPSSLSLLADHKGLTKKGIISDADLTSMTLRMMTDHCARPMLREIEVCIRTHEGRLVELAAAKPAAPKDHATSIVDDPLLGRCEVDIETGELVRVIDDHDSAGEILVDDSAHIEQDIHAKSSETEEWGSW